MENNCSIIWWQVIKFKMIFMKSTASWVKRRLSRKVVIYFVQRIGKTSCLGSVIYHLGTSVDWN